MIKGKTYILISLVLTFTCPIQAQDPQGCFLYDFNKPKYAEIPPFEEYVQTNDQPTVTVSVNIQDTIGKVSRYLYGNNANVYMSQMVTEPDLLDHIRNLSPNIIRFPGGNLSSIFFWDAVPGNPPADAPEYLVNSEGVKEKAAYWYGKNKENWTLSVDNYYNMLSTTHNTGMITINYGYARYGTGPNPAETAAGHAANWVRYDNGRTKFWEIGNESSGPWQAGFRIDTSINQDGQPLIVSGELYGEHFKIFVDSMKAAAAESGNEIYIGAQLIQYEASNSWNSPDRDWNEGFFRSAGNVADFFIVHSYYTNYEENTTAPVILNSAETETASMMNVVRDAVNAAETDMKPVALTEWNIFAVGSKQSCSYINGMHATLVLGELAKYRYGMSSRWDLANGYNNGNDHGIFNIGDEPGVPKWNPRPAFFYMYYFQNFFGNYIIAASLSGSPGMASFASRFSSGEIGIVVVNKGVINHTVRLDIQDFGYGDRYYLYSLNGGTDNGEFSQKVYVNGHEPENATGGPINDLENLKSWSTIIEKSIIFNSPGRTVQFILVESGEKHISFVPKTLTNQSVIYPNPAKTWFSLELVPGRFNVLNILDLTGSMVYAKDIEPLQNKIDIQPNLSPGVYFVKLAGNDYMEVMKLILI